MGHDGEDTVHGDGPERPADDDDDFLAAIAGDGGQDDGNGSAMLRTAWRVALAALAAVGLLVLVLGAVTVLGQARRNIDGEWDADLAYARSTIRGMDRSQVVGRDEARRIDARFGGSDRTLHRQYAVIDGYWERYALMERLAAAHPAPNDYRGKLRLNLEVRKAGGFSAMKADGERLAAYGPGWGSRQARAERSADLGRLLKARTDMDGRVGAYETAYNAWGPAVAAYCGDRAALPEGHRALCGPPADDDSRRDDARRLGAQADALAAERPDGWRAVRVMKSDDRIRALCRRTKAVAGDLAKRAGALDGSRTKAVALLAGDMPARSPQEQDGGKDGGRERPEGDGGASDGPAARAGDAPQAGAPAAGGGAAAPAQPDPSLFEVHDGRIPVYYRGSWRSVEGSTQAGASLAFGIMSFQSVSYRAEPMPASQAPAPFGGTTVAACRLVSPSAADVVLATYRMGDGSYASGVFFAGQSYRIVR